MTRPPCSVLLPVHNARPTLRACLASIAGQTLIDYELVAVNDHSTDGSRDLLAQAAAADDRIQLIDSTARGLVGALNEGLAACRSPIVARMDADDVMRPDRLARQVGALSADAGISVLASRVRLIETSATAAGQREYVRWQNSCIEEAALRQQRFVESPLAHPSVAFVRKHVDDVGGYRDGMFPEDYDLWLRLFAAGRRIAKLPEVLLDWRDGPHRLSRTDPRCARDAFDRLRARFLCRLPAVRGAAQGVVIWGAGRRTRRRVRYLQECGIRVRAWIDIDPKKIGNIIDGARVLAPEALHDLDAPFILSYVANHGAREQIATALNGMGFAEERDWLSVG